MEHFKPIVGTDHYEVSDLGRVRVKTHSTPFKTRWGTWSRRKHQGCVLRLTANKGGYLVVKLGRHGISRVHVLVMETFVGPRPKGLFINHKNGNKHDNRLANLEYCTAKRNIEHAVHTGLCPPPPGAGRLTEHKVRLIKRRLLHGASGDVLARDFKVHRNTIQAIRKGRAWAWVKL
jgi:hypothetical protein